MKQKYLILKTEEKTGLVIREYAKLDKEIFSLLCEETFDDEVVKSALEKGKNSLIATLRTQNLFPIGIYAEEIAAAVTKMYESGDDQPVELFFDDTDLLIKDKGKSPVLDNLENDDAEIDGLLDDEDIPEQSFDDENDDIKNITSPLKISDDDPFNIDDED
ncbi:MAG: hypothetical protein JRF45_05105 [Deltaproteobacteria bacterium]|nr:hypothetical protein [Deltaproteobacteria bacterium]MBW2325870.1 hypothetical protein [Deltaproteobacteria bacterium]